MMKRNQTIREKAEAYDALKKRAELMGYSCVGYALDAAEKADGKA